MQVYRADEPDAARFVSLLRRENLPYEVERFGSTSVAYVSVKSQRLDIPALARSSGRSVRLVQTLEQLADSP